MNPPAATRRARLSARRGGATARARGDRGGGDRALGLSRHHHAACTSTPTCWRAAWAQAVQAMRFVEPASGEVVALRPDLTPQVARLVATRMHDEPGPVRLYYEGSVVRLDGARREIFQIGVELIDAPQPGGDLEVVALAEAALGALGIADCIVDLGHAAIVRSAVGPGTGARPRRRRPGGAAHGALAQGRRRGFAELAEAARVSPARREAPRGAADAVRRPRGARARARAGRGSGGARGARRAVALVRAPRRARPAGAALDRSRRGARLRLLHRHALLALRRRRRRGAGVGRALRRAGRALRPAGARRRLRGRRRARWPSCSRRAAWPAPRQAGGVLVAGEPVAAARAAAELRASGERAVLELDEPPSSDAELQRRAAARDARPRVAVVGPTGIRWLERKLLG